MDIKEIKCETSSENPKCMRQDSSKQFALFDFTELGSDTPNRKIIDFESEYKSTIDK